MMRRYEDYDDWVNAILDTHGDKVHFKMSANKVCGVLKGQTVGIYYELEYYGEVVSKNDNY